MDYSKHEMKIVLIKYMNNACANTFRICRISAFVISENLIHGVSINLKNIYK